MVTKEGAYYLQWRELEPELLAQAGPAPGHEEGWSDGVKLVGAGKQVREATPHRACLSPPARGPTVTTYLPATTLHRTQVGKGKLNPPKRCQVRVRARIGACARVRRRGLPRVRGDGQLPLDAVVAALRARDADAGHEHLSRGAPAPRDATRPALALSPNG